MTESLLQVENFKVGFAGHWILQGVDLEIFPGEAVALSGASGCGKSLLARALCGLLPAKAHSSGRILWKGTLLSGDDGAGWDGLRGGQLNLMLQEPATSLNPVLSVGRQIAESWSLHHRGQNTNAEAETINLLQEVRIEDPARVSRMHPHQLSGGMKQRVLLAAALACEPSLLIADEPTTALDPTVQRDILALLRDVRLRRQMAMLFISHDPHLVALLSDRSCEMRKGRLFPSGEDGCDAAQDSVRPFSIAEIQEKQPVLVAEKLVVEYANSRWSRFAGDGSAVVKAVAEVDMELRPGMAVGLAGESGCGKTSLARALVHQAPVSSGTIFLGQSDFLAARGETLRLGRRKGQLVFQDPAGSLNPRQKIGAMLQEAASPHQSPVAEMLSEVGLTPDLEHRYPHTLSGGQRQRVALARALATQPEFLIADEVTSALDPRACRKIMSLLAGIMKRRRLAVLQISHDLNLLERWCHQVQVMLGGVILEVYPGGKEAVVRHPYTHNLHASMPVALRGQEQSLQEGEKHTKEIRGSKSGACPWAHSCRDAISTCYKVLPPLVLVAEGHLSRCPVVEATVSSTFIDT